MFTVYNQLVLPLRKFDTLAEATEYCSTILRGSIKCNSTRKWIKFGLI